MNRCKLFLRFVLIFILCVVCIFIERKGDYMNSTMDTYGSIYGTFYIPQFGSDGNIYGFVPRTPLLIFGYKIQ